MALSSLSQLELLFHAGIDKSTLSKEIDAWIEDVQKKKKIRITEVEAILDRYFVRHTIEFMIVITFIIIKYPS